MRRVIFGRGLLVLKALVIKRLKLFIGHSAGDNRGQGSIGQIAAPVILQLQGVFLAQGLANRLFQQGLLHQLIQNAFEQRLGRQGFILLGQAVMRDDHIAKGDRGAVHRRDNRIC